MPSDPFADPLPSVPVGFAGSPLDRADEPRRDPQMLAALRLDPSARWLVLDGLNPVMAGDELGWVRKSMAPRGGDEVFLGLDDGAPRFAVSGSGDGIGEARDARSVAMALPNDGRAEIVAQARSLLDWHARHRFCANCGAPTESAKAGYQRNCVGGCGAEHFPRTDPVVIMLALDGDNCLLGRQPRFNKGFYSALAGFVEPGETFEEAVRREIAEETGVRTARVRYVASQPWPFPSNLMIGAFAEATSRDIRIDSHELEDARWFTRDEVRQALETNTPFGVPPPLAIARTLLETWARM